jgi:hypothetical protein
MKQNRKKYDKSFKLEAIRLITEGVDFRINLVKLLNIFNISEFS